MTDEKQAVKTLAEQLAKAMKSVSANTPSKNYSGGTSPSTIQASKIVGLPAAFSSIISGVESSAAGGDAVAQQTLIALNHIAAGEFETITADTANIEKIYATFGDFITLVAEDAQIGSLDVDTIRAGLAEVGLLNIGTASIDMAQIKRSSTQTAFIHESVQGKVYIDDLAVNDASIVNLAAGTVLINDNSGNLVELYVDDQGNVSTRAVAYDGSDIINQSSLNGNTIINNTLSGDAVIANSLNGNKIISNSITTTQLNANEIFAAQGTIMDLIADNIEATRLFANQGFITELQSTIISSDLSENSTIIELTDSINLFASNTSRTFIQDYMPIPTHTSDTWFDPTTEEHYVANSIYLPISQMIFGHDDGGNLCNDSSIGYSFSINANGELMLLVTDEEAEEIILENDINFEIVDNHVTADGLWKKVDNVAFSRLKISVDGISSEVYDSTSGLSRITQNAESITSAVQRIAQSESDISNNSSRITQNAESITSAVQRIAQSESDISNNSSRITQNAESITSAVQRIAQSESDISNNSSRITQNANNILLESTRTGNILNGTTAVPYLETSSIKIQNNKIDVQSTGNVDIKASNFSISFNTSGSSVNRSRVDINNTNGIKVSDSNGNYFQATSEKIGLYNVQNEQKVYLDNAGNAHFSGELHAATGTFNGTLSAACITSGTLNADRIDAGSITGDKIDSKTITGDNIAALTIEAANIKGGTITGDKIAVGTIKASNIKGGTITGDKIAGTTITAGNIASGTITATQLAANSVTTDQIKAGSIIADKIKNGEIKTDKLDARAVTAEKIAVGTITATEIAAGTITGDRIAGTTITGSNIAGGTITGTNIAGTTITASNIKTGTITGTQIAGTTITGDKIAVGTITSNNIATGTITADNIKTGTITAEKIKTGTITGDRIAGTTITGDKIAVGTINANRIKGGTLVLGGSNDINGSIKIKDASGNNFLTLNCEGIFSDDGRLVFSNYLDKVYNNVYNEANKSGLITYTSNKNYQVNYFDRDIIFYKTNNKDDNNNSYVSGVGIYLNSNGNLIFYHFKETITNVIGELIESFITQTNIISVRDDEVWIKNITTPGNITASGNISATGTVTGSNITASGTKSRVVSTSQYSDRLLYCYETPSPMFGDIGEGVISEDGKCYISLDPVFAQTISTDQYQVFLQRYSEGDCYVSERLGSYFVVFGTPGLKFGWELKAKQSDFDQLRLERDEDKFSVPSQVYGEEAADYVKRIYDGRIPKDSSSEREE